MQCQCEGDVMAPLPAVIHLRHEPIAGDKILQCRGIGAGVLGTPARHEVEFGDPFSLLLRRDHRRSAVEMIYDVEDHLIELFRPDTRYQYPPDPEMCGSPFALWDERIRCLLNAVVQEGVS